MFQSKPHCKLYEDVTRIRNVVGFTLTYTELLRCGGARDRNPLGAKFSAPFQTGPGT